MKNIEDTVDCDPKLGYVSWRDFYTDKASCEWPERCCISRCTKNAEHGAHVKLKWKPDEVLIIPMCPAHNNPNNEEWMTVKANTTVVEVQKEYTSGSSGTCYTKGNKEKK